MMAPDKECYKNTFNNKNPDHYGTYTMQYRTFIPYWRPCPKMALIEDEKPRK